MPIPGPAGHRERRLSYRRISCPDCFIEEDLEMRTNFDFTPYRRSTVGFDRLFDLLETEPPGEVAEGSPPFALLTDGEGDRKSDGKGKSVSERVYIGGLGTHKKKK